MSTMILCPGCGTESDYRDIENADNPQCSICGKLLLAEVLKKKQEVKRSGADKLNQREKRLNSRAMGKKLQNLGDDDLFGELEPFDLDDGSNRRSDDFEDTEPKVKVRAIKEDSGEQELTGSMDDLDDDDDTVFANPMEKSSLMKKLKDDQDLFSSLDG